MGKRKTMVALSFVLMFAMVIAIGVKSKVESNACGLFKKENVTIYIGNDNADGFDKKEIKTKITAKKLVKALQRNGAIATNIKVRSFKQEGNELYLDLSESFKEDIMSVGTAGEYIKIGSVVNTFLDAYDANTILITVEESAWESGHAVYDCPFDFMNNVEPEQPEMPSISNVEFVGDEYIAIATLLNENITDVCSKYEIDGTKLTTIEVGSPEQFVIIPKNNDVKISVQKLEFTEDFELVPTEELAKDITGVCVVKDNYIEYIPHIQIEATYGENKVVIQLSYSGLDGKLVINDTQFVKDVSVY